MSISEKIKVVENKIEQKKAQYNLNRQTAKISALSPGSVSKYKFLTGIGILREKGLLEKAAALKRFEYLPLGKELKAQTDIAKKQHQKLDNEEWKIGKYNKSDMIDNTVNSLYKYNDLKKVNKISMNQKSNFYQTF